jgi:wyosine [tRNA(Phe)-imidazoG37] synthetase (radical SAM superfamily)
MDRNHGEIWAKLDAGTEDYYRLVNRPNYPLPHVIQNITAAARVRPVVIQSLFMRIDGVGPSVGEVSAYVERLGDIRAAGGKIKLVQIYTVARRPAQPNVTPLTEAEVDSIVERVRSEARLPALPFYGPP